MKASISGMRHKTENAMNTDDLIEEMNVILDFWGSIPKTWAQMTPETIYAQTTEFNPDHPDIPGVAEALRDLGLQQGGKTSISDKCIGSRYDFDLNLEIGGFGEEDGELLAKEDHQFSIIISPDFSEAFIQVETFNHTTNITHTLQWDDINSHITMEPGTLGNVYQKIRLLVESYIRDFGVKAAKAITPDTHKTGAEGETFKRIGLLLTETPHVQTVSFRNDENGITEVEDTTILDFLAENTSQPKI